MFGRMHVLMRRANMWTTTRRVVQTLKAIIRPSEMPLSSSWISLSSSWIFYHQAESLYHQTESPPRQPLRKVFIIILASMVVITDHCLTWICIHITCLLWSGGVTVKGVPIGTLLKTIHFYIILVCGNTMCLSQLSRSWGTGTENNLYPSFVIVEINTWCYRKPKQYQYSTMQSLKSYKTFL